HVVLGVPAFLVDVDGRFVVLAEQVALGQRRPLVGPLPLLPQQHDAPAEPLLPEGLRGLGTGHACADDHVRRFSGHQTFPSTWPQTAADNPPARSPAGRRHRRSCQAMAEVSVSDAIWSTTTRSRAWSESAAR